MSFFEDVKGVLTKTAKGAAKASNEIAQQTKLKLKASQIKYQIENAYTKIGELYYGVVECDEDNSEKLREAMDEVKMLKSELEELEAQSPKSRNVKKCSFCNAENEEGDQYCSKCGSNLN